MTHHEGHEEQTAAIDFAAIEKQVAEFEAIERRRLGLEPRQLQHWDDAINQTFTRQQRDRTTILLGGLTIAQDLFVKAAFDGLGYQIEVLDCPDTDALSFGKEFGNRGQCNPTYFTVGNLIKRLIHLRDVEQIPVGEIERRYIFLTAGACGPCRFGTYVTEYRKALRDAGFENFRVLLFQQMGGLKQATGPDAGLEMNQTFFIQMIKAIMAGDVLNAIGYRIRPYELTPGSTDEAIERSKQIIVDALRARRSILRALRQCRQELLAVNVDRLQPKPKVTIIGEFWAMTTEGAGNYHLQRFLEAEGAEVDVQLVAAWLLYMTWQVRHDTRRRLDLRGVDGTRKGLAGKNGRAVLLKTWAAEKALRGLFKAFCWAIGLEGYHLPDMDKIARLAREYYHVELRGGEGHMEVGKLIQTVTEEKAHMVLSVKPFGCMPSSGVSDGVQSFVLNQFPEAIFCPVETTGDGAVNFQSRVLMFLFKARRKATAEYHATLATRGLTPEAANRRLRGKQRLATHYPEPVHAGTGANAVLELHSRRR